MKVFVKAKPGAKETRVTRVSGNTYIVSVKEPPIDGRANAAIARALAEHLGVAPSTVKLIGGPGFKQKLFEVPG